MKKLSFTIKNISFLLLISGIIFTSCSKKDVIPEVITPANTDLSINFVGTYTGVYTSANGAVTLTQKVKVTKLSNSQIKVENNGGPIAVATKTFNLTVSGASSGSTAGTAADGSIITQSTSGLTIAYDDGAVYAGNR
jgi:hypothetical protein